MRMGFAPLIFLLHLPLQMLNLALCASLITIAGIFKLLMPLPALQKWLTRFMHFTLFGFGRGSIALIKLFNPVTLDYQVRGDLSTDSWYLIMANHLSYLDIMVLIQFAHKKIPPPKFFLKQELIWLPFVGLGAWALDMPFMKRYSQAYLNKHPHKKGQDIETTRRSCEKFKAHPTTVINFVEGTRCTPEKHKAKKSVYPHLLPPKAGGIAFTLAAMGDLFTNILDISLVYPKNRKHPMMAMLCGQLRQINIDVDVLPIPQQVKGDYFADDTFRAQFQSWLNGLWSEKDKRIHNLLEQ